MAEGSLTKKLFENYLRNLYIELNPDELTWVKTCCSKIGTKKNWAAIIEEPRSIKGILSYYLISIKCPEYQMVTTSELVEMRFSEELDCMRDLISYPGILILRHSKLFIRNKLTFESLMHVISERSYKDNPSIVVSDIALDSSRDREYIYYDHKKVLSILNYDATELKKKSESESISTPMALNRPKSTGRASSGFNKPLAMSAADKLSAENQLKSRVNSIKEGAKDAI